MSHTINPESEDYKAGYNAGLRSADEITEFATNVNTLLRGLIDSPMAKMMAQGNPQAKAALAALRNQD